MNNFPLPPITILIVTYNRPKEIRIVIDAIQEKMYYSGEVNWLIADDSDNKKYGNDLIRDYPHLELMLSRTPKNMGWGANVNLALKRLPTEIYFLIEDDYVPTQFIDLDPFVALLSVHQGIGVVRFDGIAGHRIVCQAAESDISLLLPNFHQGTGVGGRLNYWLIDGKSRELYVYSNRPHLAHIRFHNFYGVYAEGVKLGATEEMMAHTVKERMKDFLDAPALAAPFEHCVNYFDHIGKSHQHTIEDKGLDGGDAES
jgi:glycosyltransferase involved in cell wall biosynthesis